MGVFYDLVMGVMSVYGVSIFHLFGVLSRMPLPPPPTRPVRQQSFPLHNHQPASLAILFSGKKQNLSRKVARNEHGDREGNVEEAWNQDCACKSNLACIISSFSFIPDGLEGILEVYLSLRSLHLFLPRTIPYR